MNKITVTNRVVQTWNDLVGRFIQDIATDDIYIIGVHPQDSTMPTLVCLRTGGYYHARMPEWGQYL